MTLIHPLYEQKYPLNELTIDQIENELKAGDRKRFEKCVNFFSSSLKCQEFVSHSPKTCYKFVKLSEIGELDQETVKKIMTVFARYEVFKKCAQETLQITCNDGKSVPFDRQLLILSSDYFKKLLSGQFKEAREDTINFSTCSSTSMGAFKTYLYEGKYPGLETADDIQELLTLAAMIEDSELLDQILDDIKKAMPSVQKDEDLATFIRILNLPQIESKRKIALQCKLLETYFKNNEVSFVRLKNQFLIGIEFIHIIYQDNELSKFIKLFVNGIVIDTNNRLTFKMLDFLPEEIIDIIHVVQPQEEIQSLQINELTKALTKLSIVHLRVPDEKIRLEKDYDVISHDTFDALVKKAEKFKSIKAVLLTCSKGMLSIDFATSQIPPLDLKIICNFTLRIIVPYHDDPKSITKLFEREGSSWIDDRVNLKIFKRLWVA